MFNPRDDINPPEQLKKYDVFGWRAFITGSPFSYSAIEKNNVSLLVLPRQAFELLTLHSSEARNKIHHMLKSEDILLYLQQDQGLISSRLIYKQHQSESTFYHKMIWQTECLS